jgi:hypothetical protein
MYGYRFFCGGGEKNSPSSKKRKRKAADDLIKRYSGRSVSKNGHLSGSSKSKLKKVIKN